MEGDCIKTYLYMRGPFQAGDQKAAINRRAQTRNTKIKDKIKIKKPYLTSRIV